MSLIKGKITCGEIAVDCFFIQPQLKTGTECGVVPAHLVGEIVEILHIPLQRPATLLQAPQPILSFSHLVWSALLSAYNVYQERDWRIRVRFKHGTL